MVSDSSLLEKVQAATAARKAAYWANKGKRETTQVSVIVCKACGSRSGPFARDKDKVIRHVGCPGPRSQVIPESALKPRKPEPEPEKTAPPPTHTEPEKLTWVPKKVGSFLRRVMGHRGGK